MTDTSSNPSQEFWEPHYAKMTRPSGGRVSAVLEQFVEARPIGTALELGCARGDDAIWRQSKDGQSPVLMLPRPR